LIAAADDDIRVLLELSPWDNQREWDAEMRKL
jgi:hypothetical protein